MNEKLSLQCNTIGIIIYSRPLSIYIYMRHKEGNSFQDGSDER